MERWTPAPVITWLLAEGRFCSTLDALAAGLAQQIVSAGLPLWRLRLGARTLHPMITALSASWERDNGVVPNVQARHGLETRSSYVGSPLEHITQTGQPFRRILSDPLGAEDHGVLHELKARSATDYFGLPLRLTTQPGGVFVTVTDQAGGFSDEDLAHITTISETLAPIIEVFRLTHSTRAIAQAYLGPRSADRVLSGQITRGHIETIRAAILFSDLRGWTAINTQLPASETVAIANRYFDIMTEAITAQGGEVLKLMGDGILAIFPEDGEGHACTQALTAAETAQAMAQADPDQTTRFGIAMHVGDVLYGNIGSENRLDFTVLGAAVNLAARLEGLCAHYDRSILFSAAFAAQLDRPTETLGQTQLKGLDTAHTVHSLPKA